MYTNINEMCHVPNLYRWISAGHQNYQFLKLSFVSKFYDIYFYYLVSFRNLLFDLFHGRGSGIPDDLMVYYNYV